VEEKMRLIAVFVLISIMTLSLVQAAQYADTTVTFIIPSSIAISLAYGNYNANTCSGADFFFVEDDATIDGSQTDINVSDQAAGGPSNYCQSASIDAITISNDGNAAINITAVFTTALPTGVVVYVGDTNAATAADCADTELLSNSCINIATTPVILFSNVASAGSEETWWRAKFTSADLGAGAGQAAQTTRTLRINSTNYN
jgi:hypothetical protein